jgi:hypothetical protein
VIGTHIFHNEHSSPANLRAEVLDEQFTIAHTRILQERIIVQGFSSTFQCELLAGHVELGQIPQFHVHDTWNRGLTYLREFGRNCGFDVRDLCIMFHFDGDRETPRERQGLSGGRYFDGNHDRR